MNLHPQQVENTLKLLEEGATVPFISRYRKEVTGSLDEVQIAELKDRYEQLLDIAKRKETILSTIEEQGKLTPELKKQIENTWNATLLEDLYLPYKPKRRTRAQIARQRGLEPLADLLMRQTEKNLRSCAAAFVKEEVHDVDEALQGARDIIAERVNEDKTARNIVRKQFSRFARISSHVIKGKETEAEKYQNYFDTSEPLKQCSSHRLLAIRRAEAEGLLKVSILLTEEDHAQCNNELSRLFVKGSTPCATQVGLAVADASKRLLQPSIETEFAAQSKLKADEEAIRVFATNLKQLLLASPLGQKRVLAIDPGFRTGCKVVCLDAQGKLLHNEAIYPHPPLHQASLAARKVQTLIEQYHIESIAIGGGTAGRETELFISSLHLPAAITVFIVNEDGASVYSASKTARDEFPDYDVTVRGAVSIGRRLMDPLAELVKIEPKAIGVGQYQHDVNPALLKKSLDYTVESCVNTVGVNLNTASTHLLTYISGLGPQLAQNIVAYRAEKGAFKARQQLTKVARMGPKAYEQCAGFLRIPEAKNPLDNTAVHPERYALVEQMAKDAHTTVSELIASKPLRQTIDLQRYVTAEVGLPTLQDILQELDKPGRDPRGTIQVFSFDTDVKTIADLHVGMQLNGVVTNITNFGCFVNLGIKEKGLVHISQMADNFVSNPSDMVHIQQQLRVKVIELEVERKRISLSMRDVE